MDLGAAEAARRQHVNSNPPGNDAELQVLRAELRRQLALQQKNSLYAVLGLAADASDEAVAAAAARLSADGVPADAELRYAIEVLARPASREAFDRQLLDQLRRPKSPPPIEPVVAARTGRAPWLLPVTVGVVGLLLLGMAWLGLEYMKEGAEREVRLLDAQARAEESRRRAEAIPQASELRRREVEASTTARQRELDAQDKAAVDARAREERFREEREKVYQQELAREERARQDAERIANTQASRDMVNIMGSAASQKAAGR